MHENTVFSHTKCLSRNIQSWIFFLFFSLESNFPIEFLWITLSTKQQRRHLLSQSSCSSFHLSTVPAAPNLSASPNQCLHWDSCTRIAICSSSPAPTPWQFCFAWDHQLACLRPTPLQFLQQAALHLKTPAPDHHLPWCHDGKQDAITQSHVQRPRQPRPNKADPLLRRPLTARTQHTACTDARWSQTVLQAQSPPTTAATHPLAPCSAHRKRNDQNDPEWHRRHESCPEKKIWAKRACHDD